GYNTTASGLHSTAMGYSSSAGGQYSFAAGISSNASGINALAIGNSASAAGAVSIALGASASAGYQNSIAIGQSSETTDWHGVALGYDTQADRGALASGYQSKAYGQYSVASGFQAKTHANYSVSIGDNTDTQGQYSTAMGFWSISEGERSFAMGDNATSKSYGSFVVGRFNDLTSSSSTSWVATDPLFIVGNGSSTSVRSNALTVLKNGNVGIGTVTPAYTLEVEGSISANAYYGSENNDYLEIDASENFRFISNSVERMRINGSGNVGIGDSSPGEKLEVTGNITLSAGANRYIALPDAANTLIIGKNSGGIMPWGVITDAGGYIALRVDGLVTKSLYIKDDGNVGVGTSTPSQKFTVYNGTTTGTYTTSGWQHSSDRRLKTDIRPIQTSLDRVLMLQGISFNWKANSGKREYGFIAQDVVKVFPEIVSKDRDGYYSIAYGNFAPLLVEAIKEQQEIIVAQQSEIEELKTLMKELLEKMDK
ncbi:MAG: tail fiber domain-containing protein, partial [Bacteroidales bacterium]